MPPFILFLVLPGARLCHGWSWLVTGARGKDQSGTYVQGVKNCTNELAMGVLAHILSKWRRPVARCEPTRVPSDPRENEECTNHHPERRP